MGTGINLHRSQKPTTHCLLTEIHCIRRQPQFIYLYKPITQVVIQSNFRPCPIRQWLFHSHHATHCVTVYMPASHIQFTGLELFTSDFRPPNGYRSSGNWSWVTHIMRTSYGGPICIIWTSMRRETNTAPQRGLVMDIMTPKRFPHFWPFLMGMHRW